MVLQTGDVLFRSVCLNIPITPVSITLEAEFREVFVKSVNPLIFPPRFRCTKHQVTNKRLVEKLVRNLDRFHVRHVFVHLPRQMHQS